MSTVKGTSSILDHPLKSRPQYIVLQPFHTVLLFNVSRQHALVHCFIVYYVVPRFITTVYQALHCFIIFYDTVLRGSPLFYTSRRCFIQFYVVSIVLRVTNCVLCNFTLSYVVSQHFIASCEAISRAFRIIFGSQVGAKTSSKIFAELFA